MRYRAKKLPLVPLLVGLKVVYFGSACMWIPYSYSLCHGWPWLDNASLVLLLNAYYSFSKRGWLLHLEVSGRKSVHFSYCQHWQLPTALVRFSPFHEAVRNCILFMRTLTKKCLIWLLVKLVPNNPDMRVTTENVGFKYIQDQQNPEGGLQEPHLWKTMKE